LNLREHRATWTLNVEAVTRFVFAVTTVAGTMYNPVTIALQLPFHAICLRHCRIVGAQMLLLLNAEAFSAAELTER